MENNEQEYIELQEHRAMIYLPEKAVEIIVNAKVYIDGKIQKVSLTYDMEQIREMFRKADEGYIDDDDTFVITDKGLAWLEGQERKGE